MSKRMCKGYSLHMVYTHKNRFIFGRRAFIRSYPENPLKAIFSRKGRYSIGGFVDHCTDFCHFTTDML